MGDNEKYEYEYKKYGYDFHITQGMICATDKDNNGIVFGIPTLIEFVNSVKTRENLTIALDKAAVICRDYKDKVSV